MDAMKTTLLASGATTTPTQPIVFTGRSSTKDDEKHKQADELLVWDTASPTAAKELRGNVGPGYR